MTEDGKKPTQLDDATLEQAAGGGKKPAPKPPPPSPRPPSRPIGDFDSDGDVDHGDF